MPKSNAQRFYQAGQQLAIDRSGVPRSPVEPAPGRSLLLDAIEDQEAPNLEPFEHLLVVGPNLTLQDVRDKKLLGRDQLGRCLEGNLHLAALRADLDQVDAGLPEHLRRIRARR